MVEYRPCVCVWGGGGCLYKKEVTYTKKNYKNT